MRRPTPRTTLTDTLFPYTSLCRSGVAVLADHRGDRSAGGAHERGAAGHGLDGGQREALVERRHDGHLGLGVELDDAALGHVGDELDVVFEAELLDGCVARAAGLALADDDEVDVVALRAQLGYGLRSEEHTSELQSLMRNS